MDKPLCKNCNHKHWSSEPHVYSVQKEKEGPQADGAREPVGVSKDDVGVLDKETGQVARNRRWRQKDPERYNRYMREYRARKKIET